MQKGSKEKRPNAVSARQEREPRQSQRRRTKIAKRHERPAPSEMLGHQGEKPRRFPTLRAHVRAPPQHTKARKNSKKRKEGGDAIETVLHLLSQPKRGPTYN